MSDSGYEQPLSELEIKDAEIKRLREVLGRIGFIAGLHSSVLDRDISILAQKALEGAPTPTVPPTAECPTCGQCLVCRGQKVVPGKFRHPNGEQLYDPCPGCKKAP